jgi:phosphopantetheine adenylyltransferase
MKTKFTEEDIRTIKDIIEQYRDVSDELSVYQKKAEEIQDKVITLNNNLKEIKEQEEKLMTELHKKYGKFSLQDIYDAIQ